MEKHTFKRIVTFMGYPDLLSTTPQGTLTGGSIVLTLPDTKTRFFVVRDVAYDESMTPMYSMPRLVEHKYSSLEDLIDDNPSSQVWDSPILDNNHSLKIWNNET